MASNLEFVNYKQFVESLPVRTTAKSSDKSIVSNPTDGPGAMPAEDLLKQTAQNALAGNVAPVFDPTKPNDEGGYAYYAGISVTYEGKNYVFNVNHSSGAWNPEEVEQKPLSESMNTAGVGEAVAAWLDEHPEATTTVQDNSITDEKLNTSIKFNRASGEHNLGYKVLVQGSPISSQITETNTIYEIRWPFDLNGATLTIPNNCTLKFNGGMIYNGIVDLNGSTNIEGIGLNCEILNPKTSTFYEPLSKYLADPTDSTLNRKVLQKLIDSGVRILCDVGLIDIDDEISVKTALHIKGGDRNTDGLNFSSSRGFCWNGNQYSTYNEVKNLKIISDGDTFSFCGSSVDDRPKNVYFSEFSNLLVSSNNGNCFFANENKGSTNDTCVFDCLFSEIVTFCPNGCCFYSISGNTIQFEKISIYSAGIAAFYNCSGLFNSVNGVWGSSSPTFFKARRNTGSATRFRCIFNNCNVESYTGVLFDCYDAQAYLHLEFNKCSFYVKGNEGIIDFFPFDFFYLYDLILNSCVFNYGGANFDTSHCLFRVQQLGSANTFYHDLEDSIKVNHTSSYFAEIKSCMKPVLKTLFTSGSYLTRLGKEQEVFSVDSLFQKSIIDVFTDMTLDSNIVPVGNYNYFNLKSPNDVADATYSLNGISGYFTTGTINTNRKIIIRNGSTNAKLIIKHGLAGANSFFTHNKGNVELAPSEIVVCYFTRGLGVLVDDKYISSVQNWLTSGSTANRPTLTANDEGFEYYDSSLKKKILWNGMAWVNMDGTTL